MKMVSDCWEGLNAEDLIEKMFERTDADGVLYMPSFFTGDNDDRESLRCVMSWDRLCPRNRRRLFGRKEQSSE